ncbi:hypothetical protein LTS18_003630 [Coniosporium uncinatum]|uniref:Uncharacterized protein n=1 Tax=Coniosporium uncinatum TaxID=93489 RepID=A0ACC3DBI3_9PEZI|nr:hypothetical protein LTS18_003630 [Coniosporium uncinatum]
MSAPLLDPQPDRKRKRQEEDYGLNELHPNVRTTAGPSLEPLAPDHLHGTTTEPYQYERLPTTTSFRVLKLLLGQKPDDLRYELHHTSFEKRRSYEAISYAWGDPQVKTPSKRSGGELETTPSLRDALVQMRRPRRPRWLWADAICINQADKAERGHQVQRMQQIYKNASRVIVWLGTDEDGNVETAVPFMRSLVAKLCKEADLKTSGLKSIDNLYQLLPQYAFRGEFDPAEPTWKPVLQYSQQAWFRRLWVLQEINAGPDVQVLCGNSVIEWDYVALAAKHIYAFGDTFARVWVIDSKVHLGIYHMRAKHYHRLPNVLDTLSIGRFYRASDPKDHVYGMMAMPAFARGSFPLEVDYNKSPLEVYRDVVYQWIKSEKNLFVLGYVEHAEGIDTVFPSWVPRWDSPALTRNWRTQSSGADMEMDVALDPDHGFLKVCGIQFDTITEATEIDIEKWFPYLDEKRPGQPLLDRLLEARGKTYPNHGTLIDAYAWTLNAGTTHGPNGERQLASDGNEEFRADFWSYIQRFPEAENLFGQNENIPSSALLKNAVWQRYLVDARGFCQHRALLLTSKGYMGLGPKITRA